MRIIFVLAVERIRDIQFIHLLEKPMCLRISNRKHQSTESNAFAISTLKRALGIFFSGARVMQLAWPCVGELVHEAPMV